MRNIVYGLTDPRNDLVYYVGKSTVGVNRPLTHLTHPSNELIKKWVDELKEHWVYPAVIIIEEVDDLDNLQEREIYWINYYKQINMNLLNINSVIEGIKLLSDRDIFSFETIMSNIGNLEVLFKKQRVAIKISQDDLAIAMGISRSTLSLFECGRDVKFSTVKKYALAIRALSIKTNLINNERVKTEMK